VDLDVPPTYPIFAIGHASKNRKFESAITQSPAPPPPPPTYNIIIPPNYHLPQNYVHHSPSHHVPSLHDFLCALDEEQDDNVFQSFEPTFQEENIKVKHIKDLSDSQFVHLGITKIGWQIALRQASEKYA
jgi:hypothetical protein